LSACSNTIQFNRLTIMKLTIDLASKFKPGQILYMEHQATRLYVEVIEVIAERQLGWVRPLALLSPPAAEQGVVALPMPGNNHDRYALSTSDLDRLDLYDMRQGADLVCSLALFQAAIDTEVMPLLARLNQVELPTAQRFSGLGDNQLAHIRLREFIRHLWQSDPGLFN
jgi:hypothetical protein